MSDSEGDAPGGLRSEFLDREDHSFLSSFSDRPAMAYRGRDEAGWPMEWVSAGAQSILGVDADEFLASGGRLEELIDPSDRPRVRAASRRAAEDAEPFHCVYRIRSADGATHWVADYRLPRGGDPTRIEGLVADLTAFEERWRGWRRRLDERGALIGGVVHDINNVLAVLVAGTEASLYAIRAGRDEEAQKSLSAALQMAEHAASLTRRVLEITRRRSFAARRAEIELGRWLAESLDKLALAAGVGVELRFSAQDVRMPVRADEEQLLEALVNLAINARHAMSGAGRLHVHCGLTTYEELPTDERSALEEGSYVTVTVSDTGPGIPPERLTAVFEPFYTTRPGGSGLGLAVVSSFAKSHGGLATARTAPGEGAIFALHLPALPASR